MREIRSMTSRPITFFGDFNEILYAAEKRGEGGFEQVFVDSFSQDVLALTELDVFLIYLIMFPLKKMSMIHLKLVICILNMSMLTLTIENRKLLYMISIFLFLVKKNLNCGDGK